MTKDESKYLLGNFNINKALDLIKECVEESWIEDSWEAFCNIRKLIRRVQHRAKMDFDDRWVPIRRHKPKCENGVDTEHRYLVTNEGNVLEAWFDGHDFCHKGSVVRLPNVTAWMEMPKPWKRRK